MNYATYFTAAIITPGAGKLFIKYLLTNEFYSILKPNLLINLAFLFNHVNIRHYLCFPFNLDLFFYEIALEKIFFAVGKNCVKVLHITEIYYYLLL